MESAGFEPTTFRSGGGRATVAPTLLALIQNKNLIILHANIIIWFAKWLLYYWERPFHPKGVLNLHKWITSQIKLTLQTTPSKQHFWPTCAQQKAKDDVLGECGRRRSSSKYMVLPIQTSMMVHQFHYHLFPLLLLLQRREQNLEFLGSPWSITISKTY